MRAISSKLNMYVRGISIVNNNIEKLTLNVILSFFGVLALLYVIFLGNMVSNIIERRSLEARVNSLSAEVRDLELTYLSMSSDIDLALAHSMGFEETKTIFITQKSLTYGTSNSPRNDKIVHNDI